jgi:hypothetical protein
VLGDSAICRVGLGVRDDRSSRQRIARCADARAHFSEFGLGLALGLV